MPSPPPLSPGVFFHIFNRGINRENIFLEERNYSHFMHLYIRYIEPVAETYAYCLLKNHFHILLRIKEIGASKDYLRPLGSESSQGSESLSNFFNAYAKAINKAYGRVGSLFQHPFSRIPISTQSYLVQIVRYIHFNPQKHKLVDSYLEWPYSSYHSLISTQPTHLQRNDVLGWFDGREGFIASHQIPIYEKMLSSFTLDDFD